MYSEVHFLEADNTFYALILVQIGMPGRKFSELSTFAFMAAEMIIRRFWLPRVPTCQLISYCMFWCLFAVHAVTEEKRNFVRLQTIGFRFKIKTFFGQLCDLGVSIFRMHDRWEVIWNNADLARTAGVVGCGCPRGGYRFPWISSVFLCVIIIWPVFQSWPIFRSTGFFEFDQACAFFSIVPTVHVSESTCSVLEHASEKGVSRIEQFFVHV